MIVITRLGALTRRAISVVASASVGDTTAPSVKALAHPRPSAECPTHATPHMVAATTPIASREIGRRFARRSRSPVKNADE